MINKKNLITILISFTLCVFIRCNFINNSMEYKKTTKSFLTDLSKKDYFSCLNYLSKEKFAANIPKLNNELSVLSTFVKSKFGNDLDYSFMSAFKTFSTDSTENMEMNTTLVRIQMSNRQEFGVAEFLFDDNTKKILQFKILDVQEKVPSLIPVWLFSLFALSTILFNIYVIILVKKSSLKKKWLKYIMIVLLNTPTIGYKAVGGFFFHILQFQFLLGVSFSKMGYLGTYVAVGIPVGALFWYLKLTDKNEQGLYDKQNQSEQVSGYSK